MSRPMHVRPVAVGALLVGVAATLSASSSSGTDQRAGWAADLATIDEQVRRLHPDPFAINPESAWAAKLAELRDTLPGATRDEQTVQLASLVGLLDSHSGLFGPVHLYPVWSYPFPEGWFVVLAEDPMLVGSRLVSIDGTPVAVIADALRPLVPSDNESGELLGLQDQMATLEFLHGLGIVRDPAAATFVFEGPDGAERTESIEPLPVDAEWATGLIGYLMGDATEAVARRAAPIWGSLDEARATFLIGYNDYTLNRLAPVIADMRTALDDGRAARVVFDMRYLRGGDASIGLSLIDILKADERIDRPGGLTVLIGRENQSAGTVVAGAFDRDTEALLIGEPTPARADNFLCDCVDIRLQSTDFVVSIPTVTLANGDPRAAVMPDIPVELTAADFFAGRDPALELALSGTAPSR